MIRFRLVRPSELGEKVGSSGLGMRMCATYIHSLPSLPSSAQGRHHQSLLESSPVDLRGDLSNLGDKPH